MKRSLCLIFTLIQKNGHLIRYITRFTHVIPSYSFILRTCILRLNRYSWAQPILLGLLILAVVSPELETFNIQNTAFLFITFLFISCQKVYYVHDKLLRQQPNENTALTIVYAKGDKQSKLMYTKINERAYIVITSCVLLKGSHRCIS